MDVASAGSLASSEAAEETLFEGRPAVVPGVAQLLLAIATLGSGLSRSGGART